MRLPWLQIDADGMTRGEMLGRLLGIGPDAGIGITMRLWRWALELSPDGDFTGGAFEPRVVAAAIGWDRDLERLVLELAVVDLIERIPGKAGVPVSAGLVRIRGLDRYKRAWEKNQKRRPAPKAPVTGTQSAGLAPEPARKTETETETETEREALKIFAGKPAEPDSLVLELVDPPPKPEPRQPRAKPPKTGDPRHAPLVQALTDAYELEMLGAKYDFVPFDAVNVTRLLAKSADNEEIVFRWRTAIRLSLDKFHKPKVHTLGELCTHWNAYPTPPKDTRHVTEMRL